MFQPEYAYTCYIISRTLPSLSYCWIRLLTDSELWRVKRKLYYMKPSSQSPFLFSSNFGKGPSHATRLMTVYISRAVVFKECVFVLATKVVNNDSSLATPPPIAYKYNKNKLLIFWYKPLELPTDFTLYFLSISFIRNFS